MNQPAQPGKKNRTVRDQQGVAYELKRKVGEGGQGIVCETDLPGVLIKLFTNADPERSRDWVNRVNWVLDQELDGLRIARPRAMIEKPPGYVMEEMDGLIPLQQVLEKTHMALLEGRGLGVFIDTGGLRRRLALLRELAATLAELHGRGLAYGDLSPANVFVSESKEHDQVWLIDCDNLCASERLGHGHLHTPGYGAPEVVRGQSGVNSLTDAWSLAVIAFQLLSHRHPLKGDLVLDGEEQLETHALRGELPWVHHPRDASNHTATGLPLDLVATPRLAALFEDCFNAGRDDPLARPSAATWADALDAAWGLLLDCEGCDSRFYWNDERQCPFCEYTQADGLLLNHFWYSEQGDLFAPTVETPAQPGVVAPPGESTDPAAHLARYLNTGDRVVLSRNRPLELRVAPIGTRTYRKFSLACTVGLSDEGLRLTPERGGELTLVRLNDGKQFKFSSEKLLKLHQRRSMCFALLLSHPDAPDLCPTWQFTW